MRQVPQGQNFYTLIGSGHMARHLNFFLSEKGVLFNKWSRNNSKQFNSLPIASEKSSDLRLIETLKNTTHLLLAISDTALIEFIKKYHNRYQIIHFSGAFYSENAIGAHPLMTFNESLYDKTFYDQIHFILDHKFSLQNIIPELINPSHFIQAKDKPLYHSLCVMSGNFSQILWMQALDQFKTKLNLPFAAVQPYMNKIFENLSNDYTTALTGPLSRGDCNTIDKNLTSLVGRPEHDLYKAFVKYYFEINNMPKLNNELRKDLL